MRLDEILPAAAGPDGSTQVTSLAFDDRQVTDGTLFFCVSGMTRDGHDFAASAVNRGASALVVERPLGLGVPELVVTDVRHSMGSAAAAFSQDPSANLNVIGVTGTNGKTTTAWIVRSLIEACGDGCGLVGTVATMVGGQQLGAVRTTPEAIELQALLSQMVAAGDRSAAIEVSSHALELGRVDGVRFAAAVFTNLTQDHLDFHGDLDSYWKSKRRLFTEHDPRFSILNVDDPKGRELAAQIEGSVSFGLDPAADWSASSVQTRIDGSSFQLSHPGGTATVETRLPGQFNVCNVLGALAAVCSLGFDLDCAVAALAELNGVPGRFESIDHGQPFAVLVDYAHTPDSLQNVLIAARALTASRVLCVVGCGGDRDRSKRPLMGGIAAELADVAIITSDNPRSEDPEAIIAAVAAGAAGRAQTIVDREQAIRLALESAGPGDVVLIAGKGHEQGQEFADGLKLPFDDREIAALALVEAGWSR